MKIKTALKLYALLVIIALISMLLFLASCEKTDIKANKCGTCRTYVYQLNIITGNYKSNDEYQSQFCGDDYQNKLTTIWLDSIWVLQIQKDCF